ncbi:MAG: hypothetical protein KDC38_14255, partial [Planctomycetes bacterium]|nr:hypothetical protein [Planctomycetota bacterium]
MRTTLPSLVWTSLLAALLAGSAPAFAYTFSGASWTTTEVHYRINPNFPTDLGGTVAEQVEVIRAATEAWTRQGQTNITLVYDGLTSVTELNP